MSAPKGFPTQTKDIRVGAQFATVEPVDQSKYGLSVNATVYHVSVGTDLVEANTDPNNNKYRIKATAHAVLKGDLIRFTSGVLSGREIKVHDADTDHFDIVEAVSVAPSAGDSFQILRTKAPVINADGTLFPAYGITKFILDGSEQQVVEDTLVPSNNAPLPVKLTSATGPINITAGDLNVQLSHSGVNPDSTRIGDGTNLLGITVSGEALVKLNSLPTISHTANSIRIGDGTELVNVTTNGELNVAVSAALPAGDSNIGNVDIVTLPSIPAGDNNIGNVDIVSLPYSVANDSALPSEQAVVAGYDYINSLTRALRTDPQGRLSTTSEALHQNDDAFSATHEGILQLAVRHDDELDITSNDNDYSAIAVTSNGRVKVNNEYSAVNAATLPAKVAVVAGYDGAIVRAVKVDNTGIVEVSGNVNANCSGSVSVSGSVTVSSGNVTVAGTVTANQGTLCTVVDFLDTPLLNASSTNIPASSSTPLTVVASLAADVKKIQILDTTGSFIGLYADPAGTPVLKAIIGPGSDSTIELSLTAGTVLGLRNMENSAITVGNVAINFMG